MKKITRRKFLVTSAQGAAGLGIAVGCDKREPLDDIRLPSAPTGLDGYVKYKIDGTKKAILNWDKHDYTDVTGAVSEEKILGYNIYRDEILISDSLKTDTTFIDSSYLKDDSTYYYQVNAVDNNGNESPLSNSYPIKVKPPSLIYKVTNPDVASGIDVNGDVVKTMLHKAVKEMKKESTVGKAYESLFPEEVTSSTTIAIKINCLARGGLCTHPEVVEAIIDGLGQMLDGSYPISNITVFDDRMPGHLTSAGYVLKNEENDYKVITVYGETNENDEPNWGETITIFNSAQRFCKIIDEVDYIINVPVLKDHSEAGITFALKNFFGIIDKPEAMHNNPDEENKTWCDPYVSEVYKKVADKIKLTVGDAILGVHKGGPATGPTFILSTLLVGTDPVAMDMYALSLINTERKKYTNLWEIATVPDPEYPLRADARHIITAASEGYDLGVFNKEIVEVET